MGSGSVTLKQKKRVKHTKNKYLKPGALAQIRYSRSTSRDIGKKRILLNVKDELEIPPAGDGVLESTTPVLSPARLNFEPFGSIKGQILPKTPRTPDAAEFDGQSRLESLPLDLLIKIMCYLHHDQLKSVFHVSKRIRVAVQQAKQYHFNYTTPDRSRQELLQNKTPLPADHWPFISKIDGKDVRVSTPRTPKAPKHASRLARLKLLDVRQITAVLFQESSLPSKRPRRSVPPGLPRPVSKAAPSTRVLRYEEELCEAVAQNKL
ncbi:hypothetical protein ACP70R_019151 [Stipagrostis hirtigluma subsp. patula]